MSKMKVKPMLAYKVGAKPLTEQQLEAGVYVQPKLDGTRCVIQSEFAEWFDSSGKEYSGQIDWKSVV